MNQVPSLELCKKWKEIGGEQESNFYWKQFFDQPYGGEKKEYWVLEGKIGTQVMFPHEAIAAPTVGEMWDLLPAVIETKEFGVLYLGTEKQGNHSIVEYYDCDDITHIAKEDKSLANALMQMLIWQKERESGSYIPH